MFRKFQSTSDASTHRKETSFFIKTSFKNLPSEWTREKVAIVYHKAGIRGSKEKVLNLRANKYDIKLRQQKAGEWEK